MRRLASGRAVWVIAVVLVVAALMLVMYDPVMDAIFIDRGGLGTELAP